MADRRKSGDKDLRYHRKTYKGGRYPDRRRNPERRWQDENGDRERRTMLGGFRTDRAKISDITAENRSGQDRRKSK